MNELAHSIQLVATQFLLYAVGWGICALLLRERQLAVAHWAAFLLLAGVGFVLTCMRDDSRAWWPYVGSSLCFFVGYALLWRGLDLFLGMPPRDREIMGLLGLLSLALIAIGPNAESAALRVLVSYLGYGVILGRLTMTAIRPLLNEFGSKLTVMVAAAPVLLIALYLLRVLQQSMDMEHAVETYRGIGTNLPLRYGYLIGAAVFNFSFMGMVTTRLVARLREQSLLDPLTGLPNRRAFDAAMAQERERVLRGGPPFAVLALDLDNFKRVNDSYGHAGGDAVLEQAGQRLRATVRKTDLVARTGGEEFVVLAPATSRELALVLAERVRASVCAEAFQLPEGPLQVTVSVGVATCLSEESGLREMLQRADMALYQAKESGRNRVCAA